MTECRYFSGGLIELKCAIRGSLGSLGPREIKKKEGRICLLPVLRTPACSLTIVTSYRYFGSVKKKKRVRTDTKCRFTDRHRKEIGARPQAFGDTLLTISYLRAQKMDLRFQ